MILSHMQIEEIAAAVTKDFNEFFFGKDADNERSTAQATPIDQFAKDYLGLSVSFAHLSSDGSLCPSSKMEQPIRRSRSMFWSIPG